MIHNKHYKGVSVINSRSIRRLAITFLFCFLCFAGAAHPAKAAVNVVQSAKTVTGGEWKTTAKGKRYRYANGTYAKKAWRKIGGSIYRFNTGGYVLTGWIKYKGKMYYAASNGKLQIGKWVKSGGKKYYVDKTGARLQNVWIKYNGKFYYLGSTGAVEQTSSKKTSKTFNGSYIFVGDSRTVGMQMAASPADTKYIAKVNMGYSWLESTAGPELQSYLNGNPNVSVVLAFGVNDLGNVQKYISYYKKLISMYPNTRFYVESVNPVDEQVEAQHGYTVTNKQIIAFNKKLRAGVGKSRFLNTYNYLAKKGFQTSDGVHYTIEEYSGLYSYIISLIK